ncbi:acyltransferase [Agrobacterium sp. DKPNP3]|uniref:acyltransferase n=1 Tax=Agrobacterium sp. DKPNP3 TaxID=3457323 RepID=UPI004044D5C7
MPIDIDDRGRGNVIEFKDDFPQDQNLFVRFLGDNNTLRVGDHFKARSAKIVFGEESVIEIGDDCALGAAEFFADKGAQIRVGSHSSFNSTCQVNAHEKSTILIGVGCLFGQENFISSSDMHSIVDIVTGRRINPAKDITLGDRVWVAKSCHILKGASIGSGSILGAGSVLTGKVPDNCLAVGSPARAVREGVTWDHRLIV